MKECSYLRAGGLAEAGKYAEAAAAFERLGKYKDSASRAMQARADSLFDQGKIAEAWDLYVTLNAAYQTHAQDYADLHAAAGKEQEAGEYETARNHFLALGSYADAAERTLECRRVQASELETEGEYAEAVAVYEELGDPDGTLRCRYAWAEMLLDEKNYAEAAEKYRACGDYRDSAEKPFLCAQQAIADGDLRAAFEILKKETPTDEVKETIYQVAEEASAKRDYVLSINAYYYLADFHYKDSMLRNVAENYKLGNYYFEQGKYDDSADVFADLGSFSNAPEKVKAAGYAAAQECMKQKDYTKAKKYLSSLGNYKDSANLLKECEYQLAAKLYGEGKYRDALDAVTGNKLETYKEAPQMITDCHYHLGLEAEGKGEYSAALELYELNPDYLDTDAHILECEYQTALNYIAYGEPGTAVTWLQKARKHDGVPEQMDNLISFYETTELTGKAEETKQIKLDMLAETALDAGDAAQAVEYYKQITDPQVTKEREKEAYYLLGSQLLEKEEYEEAIQAFEQAGKYEGAEKQKTKAWDALGEKAFANGDWKMAEKCFTNADNGKRYDDTIIAQAKGFMEEGKYWEAYNLLITIPNNSDARTLISSDNN